MPSPVEMLFISGRWRGEAVTDEEKE